MSLIFKKLLALILLLSVAGCGYHISGRGGQMPGGITAIAIPVFENATMKPDIESVITGTFVTEFVTVVNVEDGAGAVMTGVIKSYDLTPVSYTKSDVNQEYRLTVSMSLKIEVTATGEVVWKDESVTDYEDFTVNITDVSETREREAEALRKLAHDTARLVRERMLERF